MPSHEPHDGSLRRLPWMRVWTEVPIIVTSILLAFALEAAWQRYQERREVYGYLEALRAEFANGRMQLDTVMEKNERALAATQVIVTLTQAEVERMTRAEAEAVYWDMMQAATFDPSLGALGALQSSGAIENVGDPELRMALEDWPGIVQDSREDTETMLETSLTTVEAWAQLGLTPLMLDLARGTDDSLAVKRFLAGSVADELNQSRLAARGLFIAVYQAELEGVSLRLDQSLELIERALGGGGNRENR